MARKHIHVIEKTFTVFTKHGLLLVYCFGVYHIAENFPFVLQLFEVIWKTAANPGETFTQSCADKYDGFFLYFTA